MSVGLWYVDLSHDRLGDGGRVRRRLPSGAGAQVAPRPRFWTLRIATYYDLQVIDSTLNRP
jgi:hypothetical protein